MKNGYYLYSTINSAGVEKKINMQCGVFGKTYNIKTLLIPSKTNNLFNKIIRRLPFFGVGFEYNKIYKYIVEPDFLYIRKITLDSSFIRFLKKIKKEYPSCKIILELYTFPYFKDAYCRSFKHFLVQFPFALKDYVNSKKIKKYVNRIVTFSRDDYIFGIKTIKTTNGVDTHNVTMRQCFETNDDIVIISVAYMQPHHGFERLIDGISIYRNSGGKRKIKYYVIGNGPEKKNYIDMVKKLNLEECVFFVGEKKGKELEYYYNIADIALGSLGGYKIGINLFSSLKIYEYLSKGIPILSGCEINIKDDNHCPYVCFFENDSTPIDLNKVINYLDELYTDNKESLTKRIREYGIKHVDINACMKDIIDYLE